MKRTGLMGGLAIAALLVAQEQPVIRSTTVNVQVPVTVVDKKGKPIFGLTEEDFRLYDAGLQQKIQVDEAAYPVSLVVVVQANTNARDVLNTVRKASPLLAPLVAGDTGEVAVMSFDHRVEVLTGFTADPAEIQAAFGKLKPGGGLHHLNEAAVEAIRLLNTRGRERKKLLLLISEGFDKGSAITPEDVFGMAELNRVQVYALKMKPKNPDSSIRSANPVAPEMRPPLPMGTIRTGTTDVQTGQHTPTLNQVYDYFNGLRFDSHLAAYAKFTGGRDLSFDNQRSLERAMERIGQEIHGQYLLTFAPQDHEVGYHPITVEVNRPGVDVRARHGYWAAE